jgi:hypothetical protein
MTDMLIKLYDLPPSRAAAQQLKDTGVSVRRAMAFEREAVVQWVKRVFSPPWADECRMAFGRHPVGCYIGVKDRSICGFCCTDCTFLGFLGPIGVDAAMRDKGLGRALVLTALEGMRWQGYAYAVVGHVAHPDFFKLCTGGVIIEDSMPGAYPEPLK